MSLWSNNDGVGQVEVVFHRRPIRDQPFHGSPYDLVLTLRGLSIKQLRLLGRLLRDPLGTFGVASIDHGQGLTKARLLSEATSWTDRKAFIKRLTSNLIENGLVADSARITLVAHGREGDFRLEEAWLRYW